MNTESRRYDNLNIAERRRGKSSSKGGGFIRLLLFYIVPFILINLVIFKLATAQPDYEVIISNNAIYSEALITIKLKTSFPIKDIYVSQNETEVPLEKSADSYTATVTQNGTLEIGMTLKNGMSKISYENISCIDDTPPEISEYENLENHVSVYVSDNQSGINYDGIYAVIADSSKITPSLIDKGSGLISFDFESPTIEIYVPDNNNQISIASFSTTIITE